MAAQTGHMVMSTLHTNDAPSTLTRLMNMGIPTFNIASSILLITAQRLVRRLCTCKKPLDTPVETLMNAGFTEADLDGSWKLYGPGECDRCKGSGYKGRLGLYQVMPVTDTIQRLIMANGTEHDIADQAQKEGVRDLRQSGLIKVKQIGGKNPRTEKTRDTKAAKARMLSFDGRCKTFDALPDGYARGEGCGMVVLKRLSAAVADHDNILAVIRGVAVNHDGRSSGHPSSGAG